MQPDAAHPRVFDARTMLGVEAEGGMLSLTCGLPAAVCDPEALAT